MFTWVFRTFWPKVALFLRGGQTKRMGGAMLSPQRTRLFLGLLSLYHLSLWQLSISVNKCNLLNIGRSCCDLKYYINSTQLPQCETCRDLGIVIASDLSPSHHIQEIALKAHQRANHILRCFISGDNKLLVKAFMVYVRPILEYNSIIKT